jgi:alpha-mannosidase
MAMKGNPTRLLIPFLLLFFQAGISQAQEAVDTLLQRGYVAHWLVCGPFSPDTEGGIQGALARGEAPLGDRDYMQPVGGIARLRPQHLLEVKTPDGTAYWQRAGAKDPSLDLAPFFPDADEGVAYAAFETQAAAPQAIYLDLQSPLGARVWLNGFPVRDIQAAPVTATGADRFVLSLRAGLNVVVIQVPGARYEVLARAAGMSVRDFAVQGLVNRPLLQGKSGFEIALAVQPVRMLGDLAVIPRLESAGAFSGAANDIRQDMLLTLFNPTAAPLPPVDVVLNVDTALGALSQRTPPIPPGTAWRERLPIPIGRRAPGESLPVSVLIQQEHTPGDTRTLSFATSISIAPYTEGGRVYVVAGQRYTADVPENQTAEATRANAAFPRHLALLEREAEYGFDLGTVSQWRPMLIAHPPWRRPLMDAVAGGRCAAVAAFARPDDRVVGGETLARNLSYGLTAGMAQLGDHHQAYYHWDMPGLAPQIPQLVRKAGLPGIISNLDTAGLPGLFGQVAPDGTAAYHRRKRSSAGPVNIDQLQQMAGVQRRELLHLGIASDVLVLESETPPPEPFLMGAAARLKNAFPAIRLEGSGGAAFLRDLAALPTVTQDKIPPVSRLMTQRQPGALFAQPELKQVHAALETRLGAAETFAALAALLGAQYPDAALDKAWRQVLYWSAPDRLGIAATDQLYVDTLAGYREAADLGAEVLEKALAYLAGEANTLEAAPLDRTGVTALVVFNPSAYRRTDLCETTIRLEDAPGLRLLDDRGQPVGFVADRLRMNAQRRLHSARLRFLAENVPGLGYRTYYLAAQGALPQPAKLGDLHIENEFFLLIADPATGNVIRLLDKTTGQEHALGPLNAVLALAEDTRRIDGGRELWTTGDRLRATARPTEARAEATDWMQEMKITAPFAGGRVTRTLALYRGIPRIDCRVDFDGVALPGRMLALAFNPPQSGRAPVFGERFGAITGARSRALFDFQSSGPENLSGAGIHPALNWAALAPSDHLRIGLPSCLPLGPALIVHGQDTVLERIARDLVNALTQRGIPAATRSDTPIKPDFLWTDSTEFPDIEAECDQGLTMLITLGRPDQNRFTAALFEKQPETAKEALNARLPQGALLAMDYPREVENKPAVPVLIFAAEETVRTGELAEEFAKGLRTMGAYSIPAGASSVTSIGETAESGFAVLFAGTMPASVERDGTLLLGLAHGTARLTAGTLWPEETGPLSFRYALYPFEGTWREANLPAAARHFADPLIATQADLHLGRWPGTQGFIEIDRPGIILSAVKAAGGGSATMSHAPVHPRDGLFLRMWEPLGQHWQGRIEFALSLGAAHQADVREGPGAAVPFEGDSLEIRAAPFAVESFWLLPGSRHKRGESVSLGRERDPFGPEHCAYWKHNTGAAPLGEIPVSMSLQGALDGAEPVVWLIVANHLTDRRIEGIVELHTAQGWQLGPEQVPYALGPGESLRKEIIVIPGAEGAEGGIEAVTLFAGQYYRDILYRGMSGLNMTLARNEAQIKVSIRNSGPLPAEGFLDLVVPPAYWPETGQQPEITVFPRRAAVAIPPHQSQDILFRISDPEQPLHAVARLAANGETHYAPLNVP